MEEIRVNNFSELLEALFARSWRPDLMRFRSPYAFRGQQDASQTLDTSLARLGGPYADMERHLLRNFRKYAHRSDVEKDTVWNWLAIAKHHGLPTRLLDWSFSPFVALHFATADIQNYEIDGAIWMVDYIAAHHLLPSSLMEILRKEGSDLFTVEMLSEGISTLQELDQLSSTPFVIFFEPPSLDARIVNQFALFSLMSSATAQHDAWLDEHASLGRKILLPAALKWEVRDKLDQANITERVLFPGLDGLSAWLRRQYSPRSR